MSWPGPPVSSARDMPATSPATTSSSTGPTGCAGGSASRSLSLFATGHAPNDREFPDEYPNDTNLVSIQERSHGKHQTHNSTEDSRVGKEGGSKGKSGWAPA